MMPLGAEAPLFDLLDTVSGNMLKTNDLRGKNGTVIMFICVHCPYVVHIQDELAAIAKEYLKKEIGFVAISSNDIKNYPMDSPEKMKEQVEQVGFSFPYLYDESQEVALAYQAACTPDIFLFDGDLKCYYRGRLDEATPGNGKVNDGRDLRNALDALIEGASPPANQLPSMGCNIKWLA